jgi:hypothetical protein
MSCNLNEGIGFLYLGSSPTTSRTDYAVAVPYPDSGKAVFETSRMVDSARNANGEMVGRMVGRSLSKQNMGWNKLTCAKWWEFNRWVEQGHFSLYCHFFNINFGRWETRLMYVSDFKASPGPIDPITGEPEYITDASVNVIDCGVD